VTVMPRVTAKTNTSASATLQTSPFMSPVLKKKQESREIHVAARPLWPARGCASYQTYTIKLHASVPYP